MHFYEDPKDLFRLWFFKKFNKNIGIFNDIRFFSERLILDFRNRSFWILEESDFWLGIRTLIGNLIIHCIRAFRFPTETSVYCSQQMYDSHRDFRLLLSKDTIPNRCNIPTESPKEASYYPQQKHRFHFPQKDFDLLYHTKILSYCFPKKKILSTVLHRSLGLLLFFSENLV